MAKKPEEGTELDVKPTSQVDLERRLGEDPPTKLFETVNPVDSVLTADDDSDDEGDAYVGVDPIYQNHANETDKPLQAEKGPDKAAEDAYFDSFEGEVEAGTQLKEVYGTVTTSGSTVTEAQGQAGEDSGKESSDSTNKEDAAASEGANPSSSTQG
jgi:hypothetical protein